MLLTEAAISVENPARLAQAFVDHLVEHDVICEDRGGRFFADLGVGTGTLEPSASTLNVRLEAEDLGKLQVLRAWIAEHVVELSGLEPAIVWRGAEPRATAFANFREVTLTRIETVAPRIRRLTFTGDVARFASPADIHVRLYFPPDGVAEPQWPRPGENGRTIWPDDHLRPAVRYYTVRRVNLPAREIEVDFVMHDDPGPGAAFAATARPGAICGMSGPFGRTARRAAFTLLAGDETALPAIARILEDMPRDACGAALIEVESQDDVMPLAAPEGVSVAWLPREGEPAGRSRRLLDAIRAAPLPEDEPDLFAWVACEYGLSKEIRAHLRDERGVGRDRQLVMGYWEFGAPSE